MTAYLLTIVYGLVIITWLLKARYFRLQGLAYGSAAVLFVVKTILAGLYLWVYQHYYGGGDTMLYLRDGQIIYDTLYTNPKAYLMLCFGPSDLSEVPALIATQVDAMGFWHDTGHYMVVRSIALMNLVSFGVPMVNYMFMALLSSLGLIFIYKALCLVTKPNRWLQLAVFGIPSVLFWTSGLHKEGLVLFFAGAFITDGTKLLKGDIKPLWIFGCIVGFGMLFLVRDFVAILMLPAVFALLLARGLPKHAWAVFLTVYSLTLLMGVYIPLPGGGSYLDLILTKQEQFRALQDGGTEMTVQALKASTVSLIANLPGAFYRALISPLELINGSWPQTLSAIETLALLCMTLFAFLKKDHSKALKDPYALAFLFMGISLLLLIGYIVPNIGAIVRYRSIALLFFFIGMLIHLKPKTV